MPKDVVEVLSVPATARIQPLPSSLPVLELQLPETAEPERGLADSSLWGSPFRVEPELLLVGAFVFSGVLETLEGPAIMFASEPAHDDGPIGTPYHHDGEWHPVGELINDFYVSECILGAKLYDLFPFDALAPPEQQLPADHKRPSLAEFVAAGYRAENYERHMQEWEASLRAHAARGGDLSLPHTGETE